MQCWYRKKRKKVKIMIWVTAGAKAFEAVTLVKRKYIQFKYLFRVYLVVGNGARWKTRKK